MEQNATFVSVSEGALVDGKINIMNLMTICGFCASWGEGRRLLCGGAISINNTLITDQNHMINREDLEAGITMQRGKKVCKKVVLNV